MILTKYYETFECALKGLKNELITKPNNFVRNSDGVIEYEKYPTTFQLTEITEQKLSEVDVDLTNKLLKLKSGDELVLHLNNLDSVTFIKRGDKMYYHLHLVKVDFDELKKNVLFVHSNINRNILCYGTITIAVLYETEENLYKEIQNDTYSNNIETLTKIGHSLIKQIKSKDIEVNLVRHGKTVANKENILQGVTDSELLDNSNVDSNIKLTTTNADFVYSSPLGRVIKTCEKYTNEYEILDFLHEFNWGDVDGILAISDDFLQYGHQMYARSNERYYRNAETLCELYQRMIQLLMVLVHKDFGSKVVIFTHSLPIIALLSMSYGEEFNHDKFYKRNEELVFL